MKDEIKDIENRVNAITIDEPFEKILKPIGVDLEEIKKEAAELGIPPIEVIAKVRKLLDYDQIAQKWSEIYNIPYTQREQVIERHEWYLVIPEGENDTAIAIWHPKYFADVRVLYPDKKIYIAPYTLFQIRDVEEEGLYGTFLEIVKTALKVGSTDIHFEVRDSWIDVKLRLLGVLRPLKRFEIGEGARLLKVIKTIASRYTPNLDTEEWRERQDARIVISDLNIDLRLAFTPSLKDGYQNLVIRLLSKSALRVKGIDDIVNLGYEEEDAEKMIEISKLKNGLNIMSGATGEGKSKTLNTLLGLIPSTKKILTVEDPVEYILENAVQHQVFEVELESGKKIKMDYLEYLRAFMRQDPDVILVGEWRKIPELTEALLYASETGHLVFTTLHSSRITNVPNLLINQYGLKPEDISNNVNILINQRLVRTVCKHCGLDHEITEEDIKVVEKLRFKDRAKLKSLLGKRTRKVNKDGCPYCVVKDPLTGKVMSAGYSGRTAIYEYVIFDEEVRELLLKTTSSLAFEDIVIKKVKEQKAKTFIDIAKRKIEDGVISFEDAIEKLL